jgi:hypothetical protein
MKRPGIFLVIFGMFWTAIVLLFDGFIGYSTVNQLRALSFSTVTGVVTSSKVTDHSNSDGTTHGVEIRYQYEVSERPYEGDRYRYGAGSSSDSAWAWKAVAKYSEGSEVKVFYNPGNPAESVLSAGLDGSDYMFLLFLTPFNAVMLGFWGAGISMVVSKLTKSPNGGVKIIQDGRRLRLRLPRYPMLVAGFGTTGLIAFIEMFPIAFLGGGFHPKIQVVQPALAIAYGAGVAMFLWQWQKTRSGRFDLIIDESDGTVELPVTFDRKERISLSSSDIVDVTVETIANKGSEGGTSYTYAPTLNLRDRPAAKLAEWYTQSRAQQFADWLRPQLKINHMVEASTSWKGTMPVHKVPTDKT